MNKRQREIYDSYRRSEKRSLRDAYGRYSKAKAEAWESCVDLKVKYHGHDLKVLGAGSYQFSAGFLYEENGQKMFMHITKAHNTAFPIE